jgi:preprotein translocase subunit SecF
MSIGAIVAVLHDVLISVGAYSVFRFPVTPATVIAFLTILGFSLYDTIVVFDKVDENAKKMGGGKYTYGDIVNLSMNQVLMRSLNTSLAAVLPVLSLLVVGSLLLGAVALQDFALALLVGLITGSYSSIFIATPVLAVLKERFEPKYRQLREKLGEASGQGAAARMTAAAATGHGVRAVTPARAVAAEGTAGGAGAESVPVAVEGTGLTHPPRPRKKRRH